MINIGDYVIYRDQRGEFHKALVTQIWGPAESNPSINLVFVSNDENKIDSYGRQIERNTSVVHKTNQYANGMYWDHLLNLE